MQIILDRLKGDKIIWLIVLCLSVFSILAVYSSTGTLAYRYQAGNTEYYLVKHLALLVLGFLLMYLAHLANYRIYSRLAQVLLVVSVPLLLYTLIFGSDINDARRWLTLPGINLTFQTSDLAKLALIMYTARFLAKKQDAIKDFKTGFLPIILTIGGVCALIAPADLSSAVVLFLTCLLIMFIGRVNMKYIFATVGAGAAALAILVLLAYQFPDVGRLGTWQNRIESFLGGEQEQYQVEQAKIAIAEGGLFGKGPGNSTQRNFLPHPYSDFIFAIIFEEYGLAGAMAMIFLFLAFLYRSVKIVIKSPGTFGALLAVGLALSLVIQAFINMGVAVNLLPVTGLTLPLISMGGTSLWFTSLSIGIILSVSRSNEAKAAEEGEGQEKEVVFNKAEMEAA